MELSRGIAYAAGLTHEIYASVSIAKWQFMMFRVAELLDRVKDRMLDDALQLVVVSCFQIIAETYQEDPLTTTGVWQQAVSRMGMDIKATKKSGDWREIRSRIMDAIGGVVEPIGGAGDPPVKGHVCLVHFNGAHRFRTDTAQDDECTDFVPPRQIGDELQVSMSR